MARKGTLTKVITLPDGTRKWIYAKTQEELNKKCFDLQLQIGLGVDLSNNDTFGEYALLWYKTYKEQQLKDNSKKIMLYAINNHILPYLSGYKLRDITPMHIQMLFNKLTGMSASLNSKVKVILSQIFSSAVDNGIIFRSPMSKALRIGGAKTNEKQPLSQEDIDTLLRILSEASAEGAKNCHDFCVIALQTGMRRGELCGLMWSDINFDRAELTVTHECTWPTDAAKIVTDLKTEAAHRTIPLPAAALSVLKERRRTTNSLYVFSMGSGQPMSNTAFRKMFYHASKAKLQTPLTPHILRHTYCTRLFERGFDPKEIQYLMGHATPDLTMKIYTHYDRRTRYADTAQRVRAAL